MERRRGAGLAVLSPWDIPLPILPTPELEVALQQDPARQTGIEEIQQVMGEDSIGQDRGRLPLSSGDAAIQLSVLRAQARFPGVYAGRGPGRTRRGLPSV
jgi:hypothetical protein